ncbi:hypothetical protein PIB30_012151 [Stylosanthes scabra]|uniref:Hydrophobic seed protein domain-containing protein n=1 Tax=Stylosanthes scabra TaxID=79078 RepID=A0ABU6S6B2_9FABA|nr:hypothetical protein [Stylosanthes scabra]
MGSNKAMASILALLLLFSTTTMSQTPPPMATPPPSPPPPVSCPIDSIRLRLCLGLLGLLNVTVGTPPTGGCCPILGGLASLQAGACACTTARIGLLGGILSNVTNIAFFFLLLVAFCATASCRSFIRHLLLTPSSFLHPTLPYSYPFTEIRSFSLFPSEIDIRPSLAALFNSATSLSPLPLPPFSSCYDYKQLLY